MRNEAVINCISSVNWKQTVNINCSICEQIFNTPESWVETEIQSKAAEVGELSIPSTTRLSHSAWFNFSFLSQCSCLRLLIFFTTLSFRPSELEAKKFSVNESLNLHHDSDSPFNLLRTCDCVHNFCFQFSRFLLMAMEFMTPLNHQLSGATRDSPNQSSRNFNFLSIWKIHQSLFKESRHAVCDTQQGETKRAWTRTIFIFPASS